MTMSTHRNRWSDLAAAACGVCLVASAGLKVQAFATGTNPLAYLGPWPSWTTWVVVVGEALLGVGLVSGCVSKAAWVMALVVSGTFSVVNIKLLLAGQTSCGCFGKLLVHPSVVLGIDAAALIALAWQGRARGYWSSSWNARGLIIGAVAVIAASVGYVALRSPDRATPDLIVLDALEHDFGAVESVARVTHEFRLTNTGDESIEMTGVRSTCSCSSADGLVGQTVAPGGSLALPVSITVAEDEHQQIGDVTFLYRSPGQAESGSKTVRVTAAPRPDYRVTPRSKFVDLGRVESGVGRLGWSSWNRISTPPRGF